jgi:hypothetical protein
MRTFTLMITVSAALMASLTVASADESCKAEATDEARGSCFEQLDDQVRKGSKWEGNFYGLEALNSLVRNSRDRKVGLGSLQA